MKPNKLIVLFLAFTLTGFELIHAQPEKPAIVVVGGQVRNPGVVQCRENSTFLAMINEAGGPTPSASLKRVRVVRGNAQRVFDLTDDKINKTAMAMPDDSIEVPKKNIFERIADAL